mmetsp:Transcript_45153/g.125243  ORF Transcript_45153/g.125243 Transcript_45153/m.125243 type:complete len:257 (+) Transcript_45153:352-1122(+)
MAARELRRQATPRSGGRSVGRSCPRRVHGHHQGYRCCLCHWCETQKGGGREDFRKEASSIQRRWCRLPRDVHAVQLHLRRASIALLLRQRRQHDPVVRVTPRRTRLEHGGRRRHPRVHHHVWCRLPQRAEAYSPLPRLALVAIRRAHPGRGSLWKVGPRRGGMASIIHQPNARVRNGRQPQDDQAETQLDQSCGSPLRRRDHGDQPLTFHCWPKPPAWAAWLCSCGKPPVPVPAAVPSEIIWFEARAGSIGRLVGR